MFTARIQKMDYKRLSCALPIVARLCLARRLDVAKAVVPMTLCFFLARNARDMVSVCIKKLRKKPPK